MLFQGTKQVSCFCLCVVGFEDCVGNILWEEMRYKRVEVFINAVGTSFLER